MELDTDRIVACREVSEAVCRHMSKGKEMTEGREISESDISSSHERSWGQVMGEQSRSFTDFVLSPGGFSSVLFVLLVVFCFREMWK